jgi:hypothetical protein
MLASQGFVVIGPSGTTALRPTNSAKLGALYVDLTLNAVIWFDGSGNWRSCITGAIQ